MSNKQYIKGRRKEYKFVNKARGLGFIAFRSAGSHSPVDVVIIDTKLKRIKLLQCKPDNYTGANKLIEQYQDLNGTFDVEFQVV